MSDNAATEGGRWKSVSSGDAGKGEWWRRDSGQVELLARLLVVEEKRRTHDDANVRWRRMNSYRLAKRYCCCSGGGAQSG